MMFSVRQKRHIANEVQRILRETAHPELPDGEISFHLRVAGAEPRSWSWVDIRNNGAVETPSVNPHNERQDTPPTPVESTTMKPVPCGDCGDDVPYRWLCDVCSTMQERARDRIWFAGVALQELMRQAGSPCVEPQFWAATKAEIATEAYKMADLMLAKARKDQS